MPQPNDVPATVKRRGGRPQRRRTDAGLLLAIATAGSISALAKICGVTVGAVSHWTEVPKHVAPVIATALNLSVADLRPDATNQPIP